MISGDEQRVAAACGKARPAIRRLPDAQLDTRLIAAEQHEQRLRDPGAGGARIPCRIGPAQEGSAA
nr:hypothetical protein KitaXyl93_22420 [Kitasatospora sp. Xyl93]